MMRKSSVNRKDTVLRIFIQKYDRRIRKCFPMSQTEFTIKSIKK